MDPRRMSTNYWSEGGLRTLENTTEYLRRQQADAGANERALRATQAEITRRMDQIAQEAAAQGREVNRQELRRLDAMLQQVQSQAAAEARNLQARVDAVMLARMRAQADPVRRAETARQWRAERARLNTTASEASEAFDVAEDQRRRTQRQRHRRFGEAERHPVQPLQIADGGPAHSAPGSLASAAEGSESAISTSTIIPSDDSDRSDPPGPFPPLVRQPAYYMGVRGAPRTQDAAVSPARRPAYATTGTGPGTPRYSDIGVGSTIDVATTAVNTEVPRISQAEAATDPMDQNAEVMDGEAQSVDDDEYATADAGTDDGDRRPPVHRRIGWDRIGGGGGSAGPSTDDIERYREELRQVSPPTPAAPQMTSESIPRGSPFGTPATPERLPWMPTSPTGASPSAGTREASRMPYRSSGSFASGPKSSSPPQIPRKEWSPVARRTRLASARRRIAQEEAQELFVDPTHRTPVDHEAAATAAAQAAAPVQLPRAQRVTAARILRARATAAPPAAPAIAAPEPVLGRRLPTARRTAQETASLMAERQRAAAERRAEAERQAKGAKVFRKSSRKPGV